MDEGGANSTYNVYKRALWQAQPRSEMLLGCYAQGNEPSLGIGKLVFVLPYSFKLPYIILENAFTEVLKKLFSSKSFDALAKIRKFKNDR